MNVGVIDEVGVSIGRGFWLFFCFFIKLEYEEENIFSKEGIMSNEKRWVFSRRY